MLKKMRILCVILLVSCILPVFAGGAKEEKTADVQTDGTLTELHVWAGLPTALRMNMKDLNDHPVFQEMEKRTGIKIKWTHPPRGAFDENFNLMIASRDWPDIFKAGLEKAGGAEALHEDGVILDLTDMMEEHAPNLWGILKENPQTLGQYVAADGKVYGMKMLTLDLSMNVVVGPQIRKDWLDKLELEVPETNQELYEVLKAFRDKDPNGNGLADEIPMSGVGFRDSTYAIDKMTLWPFGTTSDMYLVGDTVVYGPITPEYREGMEWTVKLYQEGLIDYDYLLNDRGKMDGKMAANQVGVVYSWQPVKYMDSIPKKVPDFYITGIPFLRKDKNSPNYCFEGRFQNTVTSTEAVITTAAEFPEKTLEWLDYPYSEDGHMLFNFGIEGETYELVDGYPRYTDMILNNAKHSVIVAHQLFHMAQNAWPIVQDPRHAQQLYTNPAVEACKIEWAKGDISRLLPAGMKFDYETKDLMNQFDIDIKTYADEFMNKLIIGQANFDEWDDFIKTVKDLGIDKVLNMYQEAYDTYQERMSSLTGQ